MNKKILLTLYTLLTISATHSPYVQARSTNKTFLATRPVLLNRADDILIRTHLHKPPKKNYRPASFNAQLFYTESTNFYDLGSYFGCTGNNYYTTFVPSGSLVPDRDLGRLIYNSDRTQNTVPNTIFLNPKHNEYGIKFSYLQDFAALKPGLYGRVLIPVTTVENNLGMIIAGPNAERLQQYFSGSLPAIAEGSNNARTPLKAALINGTQRKTGIADVDFLLGYTIKHERSHRVGIHLATSLPTGSVPDGKYAFEPVLGNGGHIASGIGIDYQENFIHNNYITVGLNCQCDYRYGFAATEKRTLTINNTKISQYALATDKQIGSLLNTIVTIPNANFLTQSVVVTPGSMLDLVIEMHCAKKTLHAWLGYNFMYKSRGSVKLNSQWNNSLYNYILSYNLNLSNNTTQLSTNDASAITEQIIDTHAASAHALTHGIYGGISHQTISTKKPVTLSISGHRAWASCNSSLATRGITCSIGMAF